MKHWHRNIKYSWSNSSIQAPYVPNLSYSSRTWRIQNQFEPEVKQEQNPPRTAISLIHFTGYLIQYIIKQFLSIQANSTKGMRGFIIIRSCISTLWWIWGCVTFWSVASLPHARLLATRPMHFSKVAVTVKSLTSQPVFTWLRLLFLRVAMNEGSKCVASS